MGEHKTIAVYVLLVICACGLPISFAQLVMGAQYFKQCPNTPMIPIFNVVSGVIGLVGEVALLIAGFIWWKDKDENLTNILLISAFLFYTFLFGWYIYGCTLVNLDSNTACQSTVQIITNVVVIMFWVPIGFVFLVVAYYACKDKC